MKGAKDPLHDLIGWFVDGWARLCVSAGYCCVLFYSSNACDLGFKLTPRRSKYRTL